MLTNAERSNRRLATLLSDQRLAEIATRHSEDMVNRDYMAHESPDGRGPAQRVGMGHRTFFGTTRENVALYDSSPLPSDQVAAQFVTMWMNSEGHRRNILSDDSTHIGVGCFTATDRNTGLVKRKCTQLFANVFAFSETAIPEVLSAGEVLSVRLAPQSGYPAAFAIVQTDRITGRVISSPTSGQLIERHGVAEGRLEIKGPSGAYGLSIHIPDRSVPGRYFIVTGPYIQVKTR